MSDPNRNEPFLLEARVAGEIDGSTVKLRTQVMDIICTKVFNAEEQFVREALIKLGWAPPERHQELIGELLWINEDVWPLVHRLTSRQTVRDRFRRLGDFINKVVE